MLKVWTDEAWAEYLYWQTRDKNMVKRINQLVQDIDRNGYSGLGKPEPLKHALQGFWSRRINEEHRLVYRIENGQIQILRCKERYD